MIRPKIIRPKVIKPNKFQTIIRPNVSKSYKTECYPRDYKTESKDYKTELGKIGKKLEDRICLFHFYKFKHGIYLWDGTVELVFPSDELFVL